MNLVLALVGLLLLNIFHVRKGQPYHVGNSIRGIRRAARRGFTKIDIDLQITIDGVIVGCHWPRPLRMDGFRDPKRKVGKDAVVAKLPWSTVSRLVAGRIIRYRIRRIEALLAECGRRGIIALLEPKGDSRFAHDEVWDHIAKTADLVGAHVQVRALPQNVDALPAARRAGFKAWEI